MKLGNRGRATRGLLLVAAPLAVTLAVLGLSVKPAAAWQVKASCNRTGWTCIYRDKSFAPTTEEFNVQNPTHYWGSAGSGICPTGNWNDCASSI